MDGSLLRLTVVNPACLFGEARADVFEICPHVMVEPQQKLFRVCFGNGFGYSFSTASSNPSTSLYMAVGVSVPDMMTVECACSITSFVIREGSRHR